MGKFSKSDNTGDSTDVLTVTADDHFKGFPSLRYESKSKKRISIRLTYDEEEKQQLRASLLDF